MIGKTDFDFFTPEHAKHAYDDEQEIIRTGTPMMLLEERQTWPDRDDDWVRTSKYPLRDDDGHRWHLWCLLRHHEAGQSGSRSAQKGRRTAPRARRT